MRVLSLSALTALAVVALSACAPAGWEQDQPVNGYAICDGGDPTRVTLHYDSGLGVESAEARVSESGDTVTFVVRLRGSGSNPAIGVPATLEVNLATPFDERTVQTVDDQAVPEVDC